MKFKRIRTEHLRNEEWFQFFTEFKSLVEYYHPGTLNIEALFAIFVTLYVNADNALEVIRKSATTEQLVEADRNRDTVFRGFLNAVKSALDHFDPLKREAARRLQIVFDHYGNIARQPYDAETASIHNFVQEMNGVHAADIAVLSLNDWVFRLDEDNRIFEALKQTRYTEKEGKPDLSVNGIRKELDRNYRDILDRIDASILLNGEAQYAAFVNAHNIRVEHYDNIIAKRKGWNAKKKDATEENEQ
jgi:hypothetical protein